MLYTINIVDKSAPCQQGDILVYFAVLKGLYGLRKKGTTLSGVLLCCSMIWSVCAGVNEAGRKKVDTYIREMEGVFPLKDTVYEYFVDVRTQAFVSWELELPDSWRYDPESVVLCFVL